MLLDFENEDVIVGLEVIDEFEDMRIIRGDGPLVFDMYGEEPEEKVKELNFENEQQRIFIRYKPLY